MKKSILFVALVMLVSNSFAGGWVYTKISALQKSDPVSVTGFYVVNGVEGNPNLSHIYITVTPSNAESNFWGSCYYAFGSNDDFSQKRANKFLSMLIAAKTNGVPVQFVKSSIQDNVTDIAIVP